MIQIPAVSVRLLSAIPLFIISFWTIIYIPTSLTDHGRASVFWCGLLALACAGAYTIDKCKHHIWSQILALHEEAKASPKGEKLETWIQGLKGLDFIGCITETGERDRLMAWLYSVLAVVGVVYALVVAGVQNLRSDSVRDQLERFVSLDATHDIVFGSSSTHGSYTLESWTCQIAPLLSKPEDMTIYTKMKAVLDQACRDGRNSRYLLLIMLALAILMLLTIAKSHWFTFTLGGKEKPAWMRVPLQDNDSDEEDDDPMSRFGGNARDQWQLDSD
ncbi:hypothetical protein E4T44_03241 [Aureobasidium sp. EXF-8845]|nr:hypothetical protein E4T44_03241 [Aureobasidium sp. EXF-8845]KAI4855327.1 hypothetical protein E4T45_03238 [Aureobasidium sp. EXF-8846]